MTRVLAAAALLVVAARPAQALDDAAAAHVLRFANGRPAPWSGDGVGPESFQPSDVRKLKPKPKK